MLAKSSSDYNSRQVDKLMQNCTTDSKDPEYSKLKSTIQKKSKESNKIFLLSGEKTLFSPPSNIRNDDYWASSEEKEKYFKLKIVLNFDKLSDVKISTLGITEVETIANHNTSFTKILFHELIHVLDFLLDDANYRLSNTTNDSYIYWKKVDILWPSLEEINDCMKMPEVWDCRITELRTLIGTEFNEATTEIYYIGRFSELTFSIAAKEKEIRLPYVNCIAVFSGKTSKAIIDSGNKHVKVLSSVKF